MSFKIKYLCIDGYSPFDEMEELTIDQAVQVVEQQSDAESCELYLDDETDTDTHPTPNIGLIFRRDVYVGYGLSGDDQLSQFFIKSLVVGDKADKLRKLLTQAKQQF